MAIINNNVQNVKFLRNQNPFESRELARQALENNKGQAADGTALLARYTITDGQTTDVKTLVGFVAEVNSTKYVTIIDVEGGSEDVEKLREEINAILGDGVSSVNTVTAQLTALSGNTASTSAETSVEGAKRYADELKNQMDYTGVTTGTGVYVTNVTQSDGIVSATTATLPSVTNAKEAKKVVVSVSEDKGEISIERGTISSTAETMVLTDNTDGGVNFEVNIDGASIVQDPTSKKIKVADSALTQYFGDEKTIHAEVDAATNKKTFNTLLKIVKNANPSSTEVKEEYYLADADGTAITGADTIKIYKDSHIVSITYITDSGDTHYQNLEYKYIDASGATKTEYVDISSLVLEAEFASGVTITDHIAHGVVDPQSEKDSNNDSFLTVGADGFKVDGIKDEIDAKIGALDATVGDTTVASGKHVAVQVVEEAGVITAVTVTEDDIASADDIEELSGKTITAITSTNGSITASISNEPGNKTADIQTDADKIKMSGFTPASTASSLSNIAESDSIATAFEKVDAVITENERVTAAALTDLDGRLDVVEDEYISGVSVNGVAVTPANKVAPISITPATSAATATSTEAIVVDTDANGNITLGIANIDCGYYDGTQG
jgi:hypothetical protein